MPAPAWSPGAGEGYQLFVRSFAATEKRDENRRDRENLERLAEVLRGLGAELRGALPRLPFQLDAETLHQGANFTFSTRLGAVDILGDPAGAPPYERLREDALAIDVRGYPVRIASLDHLIAMKEAAGRPRDKLMASEYRVLSDALRAPKDQ